MQNRYLEILHLQPGASKQEVKAAYRRLSKQYHPDRNPSADAAEKFLAINEAYRFLMEVGPSPQKEKVAYAYNPHQAAYEEQRRRAYEYARARAREEKERQDRIMAKLLGYFDKVAVGILLFNLLLAADFLLPRKEEERRILAIHEVNYDIRGSSYQYTDFTFEDVRMRVRGEETGEVKGEEKAVVVSSRLLGVPSEVRVELPRQTLALEQRYSVFRVFGYIIPLLFGLLAGYFFLLPNPDHRLGIALWITVLTVVQLFLFFRF